MEDTIYIFSIPSVSATACFEFVNPIITDRIILPPLTWQPHLSGATISTSYDTCLTYTSPVPGNDVLTFNICNDCEECVTGTAIVQVLLPDTVCTYETTDTIKVSKISGADTYAWSVSPTGPGITHPNGPGPNDTIIIVNWSLAAGGAPGLYWISVYAENENGTYHPRKQPFRLHHCDLGDAPEPGYPTLFTNNGARHRITGGHYLGSIPPDGESNGQPNAHATGDGADEDGVTLPAKFITGSSEQIAVEVHGTGGKLNAWIDWDQANAWTGTAEQVASDVVDGGAGDHDGIVNGIIQLLVNVPLSAQSGTSFARFRWSAQGGLTYTGAASNGEVEDYEVQTDLSADLHISKNDGSASYTPGATVLYTVAVGNNGPREVVNATVTDNAPAGTTISGWTAVFAGGASGNVSGSGNISEPVSIPVGGTITYSISLEVPSGFTGNLTNTASVAVPAATTDPNPSNNSATDTDTQNSIVDLGISKNDSPDPIVIGNTLTYTMVAGNSGLSDAPGVQLADVLPAGISNGEFSLDNGSTWAGWSSPISLGTIVTGNSVTILIRGQVSCDVADNTILTNTATVSGLIAEANLLNNEVTATTTVTDLEPATINAGSAYVCHSDTGVSYSVIPVTGAISYTWTVPSGSVITGGQGTREITISAGSTSGNICVTVTNGLCTGDAVCIPVTIHLEPGKPKFK